MKERNYGEKKCNVKRKYCDVGVTKWLFVYPKDQSKAINI